MPQRSREDILRAHRVTLDGLQDAARTMLFVHGFGTNQSAWAGVTPAFRDSARLVLFDQAGAPGLPPEDFVQSNYLGLGGYADDLLAVCRALDLRDVVLVGHSFGAMVGVLAAIRAPEHIGKLVLIGASPRYLDDTGYRGGLTDEAFDQIYSAIVADLGSWADAFSARAMRCESRPELVRHFASTLKSIPAERLLTVLCAILQSDHRADLRNLRQPTLIVQSLDDALVPREVAEFLHREIAGSRLVEIDAQGHFPHLTATAAVVEAIRGFV